MNLLGIIVGVGFSISGALLSSTAQPPTTAPPPPTAQTPEPKRAPVHGKLVDGNGAPVAGATLYLGMWDSAWPNTTQTVVTTRADGAFTWNHSSFPYAEAAVVPPVSVLSPRSGWQMTPVITQPQTSVSYMTRQVIAERLVTAEARWINNKGYVNGKETPNTGTLIVQLPATGTVKLSPRGANGERYRNHAVELWPASRFGADYQTYRWNGRTDKNGDIFLPQLLRREGGNQPSCFHVILPGTGYADSAPFELKAGQTVTVALPALAPLATITGTVAESLRKPGQVVRLASGGEEGKEPPWAWRQAPVDAQGRWLLRDVVSGSHTVYLFDTQAEADEWASGSSKSRAEARFVVASGRTAGLVGLLPRPQRPKYSYIEPKQTNGKITGRILNPDGSPASEADIWGVYDQIGIRRYTFTLHAKTESDGTYHLNEIPFWSNNVLNTATPVTLIATRAESAPVLVRVVVNKAAVTAPDLRFSREDASLIVTVQTPDGSPAVGVPVEAQAELYNSVANPYWFNQGDAAKDLRQVLVPHAVTARDGSVRFTHLRPDRYRLSASLSVPVISTTEATQRAPVSQNPTASSLAMGVPVAIKEEARHTLCLLPVPAPTRVRLVLPDGSILKGEGRQRQGAASTGSSAEADYTELWLPAGMTQYTTALRAAPPYTQTDEAPKLVGQATLAQSSRSVTSRVVDIHLKRQEPSRLTIYLVDESGHPVAGTVYLSDYADTFRNGPEPAGSAAKEGRLVITRAVSGPVTLRAEATGEAPLPDLKAYGSDSLPGDTALKNLRRWPAATVAYDTGKETTIRLKAVRVGWVRGKMIGAPTGNFWPLFEQERQWGTATRYDARSGEYLIGPLPPGPVTLDFQGTTGGKRETVTIAPGQVLHHDITVDPALANQWERQQEQVARLDQTPITVVDADGKPVAGAHVFVHSTIGGTGLSRLTDDTGEAHAAPTSWALPLPLRYRDSSMLKLPLPKTLRWVAFVPGEYGAGVTAAIAPGAENMPQRIVLPPRINLIGNVTVGGKALSWYPGAITVYARCEDYDDLAPFLSVSVSASAEGTFRLQGLTPGRYTIQATLDDTYFSDVQTVTLTTSATTPPPLALTIEEPGQPMTLDLGKASASGRVLPVEKPHGPLAELLATEYWAADGAGVVRLEGLSAGRHKLRLPDGTIKEVIVAPEK